MRVGMEEKMVRKQQRACKGPLKTARERERIRGATAGTENRKRRAAVLSLCCVEGAVAVATAGMMITVSASLRDAIIHVGLAKAALSAPI